MLHESDITNSPLGTYEKRKGVFPKAVNGPFRRLKWAIMFVTLTIYYATPWIRWDRGPYAPNQAVLVDIANRRFYMFDIEIWPHEFYFVVGLLVMAGVGLFLVTSAVGRAWCGYSCPQTVWTDLFQHVDRFIDGDRNSQIRLQNAPWTPAKLARRMLKWSIYLFIAFWTGGAWIMYFADAPTLTRDFWTGQAAPVAYMTVFILTMTTFIFGGFMREQVCIYMCPWPRIQTAMMDERSLLVTYRHWRGEPRGSVKKAEKLPTAFGDCVDCNQCVAVCPTGIDIREGPQIGCITCALCIDACDKVMAQVGRPRGLIDYITDENAKREQQNQPVAAKSKLLLHPRTIVYFIIWSLIGLAMLFALGSRTRLDVSAQHDRNPLFVRLSDGSIRNAYTVKVRNMESRPRTVTLAMQGLDDAKMWAGDRSREEAARTLSLNVSPDAVTKLRLFVIAPDQGAARSEFQLAVQGSDDKAPSDSSTLVFERAN